MTTENGYQDLVGAARSLVMVEAEDLCEEVELADEQLESFLNANRTALDAARDALARPCRVPLEYSADFYDRHMDDIRGFRDLSRALALEVKHARRARDLNAAAIGGINILDLANAIRNGGLITDLLVSIAINGVGVNLLRQLQNEWSVDQCIQLSAELLRVDGGRESFEDVARRDQDWEQEVLPLMNDDTAIDESGLDSNSDDIDPELREALENVIKEMAELPRDSTLDMQRPLDDRESALTRLLAVDLAVRAYRQVNGRYPKRLGELVPRFIGEIPLDPFDGKPLRYRRHGARFSLYSVGPSGSDNGGTVGHWWDVHCGKADLSLQMLDIQPECLAFCASSGVRLSPLGRLRSFFRRAFGFLGRRK